MATKLLKKRIQGEAYQLVFWQLIGVLLIAFIAFLLHGIKSGVYVFAGGMAYGLPNLIFVWRVFRYAGANQMTQFVSAFFAGEVIKLILSAILFLFIVKYLPDSLLSALIGFIGAMASFWVVCMWHFRDKTDRNNKERLDE